MQIHLIAIGGAIMHQIAITCHQKGYHVSGSDDVIQEPSKSRLEKAGLLPSKLGFHAESIHPDLDLVILGMHAKLDNPELTRAMELGLKVLSFPEFVYEHSREKTRVVIAGSHGKTSITSMIMHCLKETHRDFDYMVGSSVEGFEHSVRLSDAPVIIIEGDEYLASPINKEPKFIYYHAHYATLSGIEWDHINVFKTEEIYDEQFRKLVQSMEVGGTLYYYHQEKIKTIVSGLRDDVILIPYEAIPYHVENDTFYALLDDTKISLEVFGRHNMENISAAKSICNSLGMTDDDFYHAISSFRGAGRRLEVIVDTPERVVYKDFAHSPSKLRATIDAVREKYPHRSLIACFEMHTYSTLSADFLPQYRDSMKMANHAVIFIDKDVVEKKGNTIFSESEIKENFNQDNIQYITDRAYLEAYLEHFSNENPVYLMMTSGTFGGLDFQSIGCPPVQKEEPTIIHPVEVSSSITEKKWDILPNAEQKEVYLMWILSYLFLILSPLFFYFKNKSNPSNTLYNAIATCFNFQIVSTSVFGLGILLSLKFSFLFFIGVIFNIYYINKAIQYQRLGMALDLPNVSGMLLRIDKS